MDEEVSKICSNCKRDIPVVNFLVHSVHCARNIKVCPTCKEPVPHGELQQHHDKQHASNPCRACGESVCGTDLEDHVRDSCAHTIRPCRFCELELPRHELPQHEGYCGSRTEQCAQCREWVMIKYRQLHLDSNHGFIKLDDEPPPLPRPAGFTRGPQRKAINAAQQNNRNGPSVEAQLETTKLLKPVPNVANWRATERLFSEPASEEQQSNSSRPQSSIFLPKMSNCSSDKPSSSSLVGRPGSSTSSSGLHVLSPKRTNDRPQVNTAVAEPSKVKDASTSRGAIKKRPAPKPPASNPTRDLAYYSALSRHQREEKTRQEINAHNLANGLPPVLNAAEKLEKLRKMDALHNRETVEDDSYKSRLQGRCWRSPDLATPLGRGSGGGGHVLAAGGNSGGSHDGLAAGRSGRGSDENDGLAARGSNGGGHDGLIARGSNGGGDVVTAGCRNDFKNLEPMTQQQFLNRFQELQMRGEDTEGGELRAGGGGGGKESNNRFNEIKSSLRELRKGLNEVTAPYNSPQPSKSPRAVRSVPPRPASPSPPPTPPSPSSPPLTLPPEVVGHLDGVTLPCEFCEEMLPAEDLVLHQTGCRPDITQYRSRAAPPRLLPATPPRLLPAAPPRPRPAPPPSPPPELAVIPCEFCTQPLPIHLITEHQERCGREANLLYAD